MRRHITIARRTMAAGLVVSFCGTALAGGVLPGLVAIGLLPVWLVAAFQTLENIEDVASPVVARWLRGRDPTNVLVGCEAVDVVACAAGLLVMGSGIAPPAIVFVCYLAVASVLPLVTDIAEELFAGELARFRRIDTLKFNTMVASLLGFAGAVIARPGGSIVAQVGPWLALAVNLVLSLVGLGLRSVSSSALRRSRKDLGGGSDGAAIQSKEENLAEASPIAARPALRGPGNPLASLLLAGSAAMVGGYLPLWVVRGSPEPSATLALVFVGAGIGATLGPLVAGRALHSSRFVFVARFFASARAAVLTAVGLLAIFANTSTSALVVASFVIAVHSFLVTGSAVVQATSRQLLHQGADLARLVGWAHGAAAAGGLTGAWCGLWLDVPQAPALGCFAAAAVSGVARWALGEPSRPGGSAAWGGAAGR